MRRITKIIVHCSATPEGIGYTAADIDRWHRQRGWDGCGYHYVILLDGTIQCGRPESVPGAHCKDLNSESIGICYIGGLDSQSRPKDTRTTAQKASLLRLLHDLRRKYPDATIHGHNEFAHKACPCFDVREEYYYL